MKIYIIIACLATNVGLAQITFFACPSLFTSSPNEYAFVLEGTDATGRNYYQTNPIDGQQSCAAGVCEFRIAWNQTSSRWELLIFQNQLDFSDAIVVYHNSSNSSPNPPSLNLGTWEDTTGSCGGVLTESNGTLSGDVQDDLTLSLEDLALLDTQISIYPNPASQTIFVNSSTESVKEIILYSLFGAKVLRVYDSYSLDVSDLSKGVYLIQVTTNSNKTIKRKVVIN